MLGKGFRVSIFKRSPTTIEVRPGSEADVGWQGGGQLTCPWLVMQRILEKKERGEASQLPTVKASEKSVGSSLSKEPKETARSQFFCY